MNRLGIIYEIQGIKAVVLTSEGEFLIIRRRKDMKVGQQVSFENEDIYNVRERDFICCCAVSSVAAVLVVMFLYFQSAFLSNTDNIYGYICVDINPALSW